MALDAGTITWIPGGGVQPSSPGAAAAAASPVGVAVDRRDVYYASRDRIGRVPLGGGTPASAPLATLAGSLAVDEAAVYVAAVDGIYRIAK
jgi:hypothetical protein